MVAAILSVFGLALLAPWIYRRARGATGWILATAPCALAAYLASFLEAVSAGEAIREVYPWAAALGVELSFRVDGLGLLFAFVVSGMGALVLIYSSGYLAGHHQLGRFYSMLLVFMGSMLGVALSDNLITLFVFWELTSVSSYLLIGFDHEREAARKAALQALLVTGLGGLALLAGLLLLGSAAGTMELSRIPTGAMDGHRLYLPALSLILLGAFTKSAQFPFHFWLPNAMEAPAPVSAYLHAAAMVKAGVYLIARMLPILGGTGEWVALVAGTGAITMLLSAYLSFCQAHLKRILAYSTVSALGVLMFLLGLGTKAAVSAALVFFLAHVFYKGALFLAAGNVDHETGTSEVARLGGLWKAMPWTAAAVGAAAVVMAGLPPSLGFIAKEGLLLASRDFPGGLAWTALTSVLLIAAAGLVSIRPFFGSQVTSPKPVHEAPASLLLGPLLLGFSGLVFGLFPGIVQERLLEPAAAAATRKVVPMDLALWHGWNMLLLISLVSIASGAALFVWRERLLGALRKLDGGRWGPARWYEAALKGMLGTAEWHARTMQSGYLRYYLLTVVAVALGLVGYGVLSRIPFPQPPGTLDVRFHEALVAVLILAAAAGAVASKSRLAALVALGVVGYGVGMIFALFSAPDLAITQLIVETLLVILFVYAFYRLPKYKALSSVAERVRDGIVAACAGGLMTLLTLAAIEFQLYPSISGYFGDVSVPEGHGQNVVNVILVDFRAVDTMGEITVIAAAAAGVFALLRARGGEA